MINAESRRFRVSLVLGLVDRLKLCAELGEGMDMVNHGLVGCQSA